MGDPGFIGVLHTWNQTVLDHFHLHCLVPGGVLSDDKTVWTGSKDNFLFKTRSLVKAFKNIYIKGFRQLKDVGHLKLPGNTAKYETESEFNRLVRMIGKKKWSGYV